MKTVIYFMLMSVLCVNCFAKESVEPNFPDVDVAEIKKFFSDFTNVLNANDAERVKQMSGSAWAHFSKKMDCDEKVKGFEIVKLSTDKVTNVVTKATVVDTKGNPYNVEVVFDLKKVDGVYSIDKMRLPESERRHEEFETANQNFKKLIAAIKSKDIGKAKDAFTFGDVADFDAELTARGLSWIEDAANSDVVISGGWGVRRSGKEGFVGHVEIANEPGGTNVLHEVIFKGLKIDRAAPPKETYEEFCKRFEAKKEASRKQWEEREAARRKQLNEQFIEQLRKQQRNGAGAK